MAKADIRIAELKPEPTKLVAFRIPLSDLKTMQALAKKFTGGNLTAWVKWSATRLPDQKELIDGEKEE